MTWGRFLLTIIAVTGPNGLGTSEVLRRSKTLEESVLLDRSILSEENGTLFHTTDYLDALLLSEPSLAFPKRNVHSIRSAYSEDTVSAANEWTTESSESGREWETRHTFRSDADHRFLSEELKLTTEELMIAERYDANPCNQSLDIVFLQDLTASAAAKVAEIEIHVREAFEKLHAYFPEAHFSLASFRDKPLPSTGEPDDYCARINVPLTPWDDSEKSVQRSSTSKRPRFTYGPRAAGGGGDWEDNQLGALIRVIAASGFNAVEKAPSQHSNELTSPKFRRLSGLAHAWHAYKRKPDLLKAPNNTDPLDLGLVMPLVKGWVPFTKTELSEDEHSGNDQSDISRPTNFSDFPVNAASGSRELEIVEGLSSQLKLSPQDLRDDDSINQNDGSESNIQQRLRLVILSTDSLPHNPGDARNAVVSFNSARNNTGRQLAEPGIFDELVSLGVARRAANTNCLRTEYPSTTETNRILRDTQTNLLILVSPPVVSDGDTEVLHPGFLKFAESRGILPDSDLTLVKTYAHLFSKAMAEVSIRVAKVDRPFIRVEKEIVAFARRLAQGACKSPQTPPPAYLLWFQRKNRKRQTAKETLRGTNYQKERESKHEPFGDGELCHDGTYSFSEGCNQAGGPNISHDPPIAQPYNDDSDDASNLSGVRKYRDPFGSRNNRNRASRKDEDQQLNELSPKTIFLLLGGFATAATLLYYRLGLSLWWRKLSVDPIIECKLEGERHSNETPREIFPKQTTTLQAEMVNVISPSHYA